ncbi:hypothetical protein CSUI_004013 [Cystoisospora suis]|uniref:Uncharacterized protein n=1 Tax=Cystoisospora suis TaxID=483139 RepID=A0A2C6L0B0_9APIC|nr:hypothetical protein CSUI_004013 [Cystoisospora suis]
MDYFRSKIGNLLSVGLASDSCLSSHVQSFMDKIFLQPRGGELFQEQEKKRNRMKVALLIEQYQVSSKLNGKQREPKMIQMFVIRLFFLFSFAKETMIS